VSVRGITVFFLPTKRDGGSTEEGHDMNDVWLRFFFEKKWKQLPCMHASVLVISKQQHSLGGPLSLCMSEGGRGLLVRSVALDGTAT
jgi:hypothetical protein